VVPGNTPKNWWWYTGDTQGGPQFLSQLAEFLIACRNARLTFQNDFRTIRGGLDDFSDTEDEAL
jgi:hypothetical protein